MEGTVSLVAIIMWVGALALIGFAARRRDESLQRGMRIGGGYFVVMAPRMFFALFMAGFAAELLPGELISSWLGDESGFKGIMIASVAGMAVPAGGVVAFPLALAMYKIGVGIPQLTAFLTTTSHLPVLLVNTHPLALFLSPPPRITVFYDATMPLLPHLLVVAL